MFFHFSKDGERGKPYRRIDRDDNNYIKCEICGKPQSNLHELREHKRKLVKDGGHAY